MTANLAIIQLLILLIIFNVCKRINAKLYSDQFVVQIAGGSDVAKQVAKDHGFMYLGEMHNNHYHLQHRNIQKRSIEKSSTHHELLSKDDRVQKFNQQIIKKRAKRDLLTHTIALNDPKWPEMWYLNRGKGLDMNVEAAWAAGATGKGVVVTILDDGLEKDHPDLIHNYDPAASYDINDKDFDPHPRYDGGNTNRHGTRCAGEVAASANNSLCSVGIAYDARVGGIRMLDGEVTDAVEARSLSHNFQHIDIYSASWGPDDNGKTVDGPSEHALYAFKEGVEKGRNGLGSVFIWASGNGGREWDNCNCDGYTNSIWTLSISSATENGLVPWYSEACSSSLATTYSSGSAGERQVISTDLHHGCTSGHTGTSASAPLAAGICALALDANPNLTWRDMQHIVVRTAKPENLFARDWATNGVGRNVSHSFGYGMMDAYAMVKLARIWTSVPQQKICEIKGLNINQLILPRNQATATLIVNCGNVKYLEHVQAKLTISATKRGDLHIYLTSPMGTKSTLLAQRPPDSSRSGFDNWPFMTVHMWGENPNGIWKLEIFNDGRYGGRAMLKEWNLVLYGTSENPDDFIFKKDKNSHIRHHNGGSSEQHRSHESRRSYDRDSYVRVPNIVTFLRKETVINDHLSLSSTDKNQDSIHGNLEHNHAVHSVINQILLIILFFVIALMNCV
ncbi:UNVERIFIED_CONTAM: Fur1 [Trichonephila clavipes]